MGNLDPHPSNLARPAGMMGVGTLTCVSFSVLTGVQEYSIGFILLATFFFFYQSFNIFFSGSLL